MNVLQTVLAIGWRGAADVPLTPADALWSLAGALLLMGLVVWLARISVRQRAEDAWERYGGEDEDAPARVH